MLRMEDWGLVQGTYHLQSQWLMHRMDNIKMDKASINLQFQDKHSRHSNTDHCAPMPLLFKFPEILFH